MQPEQNLSKLIEQAKEGDEEATIQIFHYIAPIIQKHSRHLGYDDAFSDLVIWLLGALRTKKKR